MERWRDDCWWEKKIRRPQNARNIRVSQYQGTGDDTAWLRGCDGY